MSHYPVKSDAGTVVGVTTVVREVTERKRAEAAHRKSQERFALAVQGTDDGLWEWDVGTDEVYYSPCLKTLLGFQEHEFPHTFETLTARIHPDDYDVVQTVLSNHLEHCAPFEVDYRLCTKSGEYRSSAAPRGVEQCLGHPRASAAAIDNPP